LCEFSFDREAVTANALSMHVCRDRGGWCAWQEARVKVGLEAERNEIRKRPHNPVARSIRRVALIDMPNALFKKLPDL
jgi:hypothetical protein